MCFSLPVKAITTAGGRDFGGKSLYLGDEKCWYGGGGLLRRKLLTAWFFWEQTRCGGIVRVSNENLNQWFGEYTLRGKLNLRVFVNFILQWNFFVFDATKIKVSAAKSRNLLKLQFHENLQYIWSKVTPNFDKLSTALKSQIIHKFLSMRKKNNLFTPLLEIMKRDKSILYHAKPLLPHSTIDQYTSATRTYIYARGRNAISWHAARRRLSRPPSLSLSSARAQLCISWNMKGINPRSRSVSSSAHVYPPIPTRHVRPSEKIADKTLLKPPARNG